MPDAAEPPRDFPSAPPAEPGHPVFAVAFCRWGDEPRVLVMEGDDIERGWSESLENDGEDYWPLPKDRGAYPLLAFDGTVETDVEYHARICGCDHPGVSDDAKDEDCEWCNEEEWPFVMDGKWRKATASDLIRAKLVAPEKSNV
jgi:hypothetical protein